MQGKNLGWKFAFVGLLIAMCVYAIWANGLREGIDLKGGYVMTFEVKLPDQAQTDTINQVVAVLKARIDPNGLYMLEWKPVGKDRFEVRMPMGTDKARLAREEYLKSRDLLVNSNIQRSKIYDLVQQTGPQREAALVKMAGGNKQREEALRAVVADADKLQAAQAELEKARAASQPKDLQDNVNNAEFNYERDIRTVFGLNIDIDRLQRVLDQYVPAREKENLDAGKVRQRMDNFDKGVKEMLDKHPDQADLIKQVRDNYVTWTDNRIGLDDPADLKRMVAAAGVLEFRMAPTLPGAGGNLSLTNEDYTRAIEGLATNGPQANSEEAYRWFPIHGESERFQNLVTGKYLDKKYVLLFNKPNPDRNMLHTGSGGAAWSLKSHRTSDQNGRPAVGFELDPRGSSLFGHLTSQNIGNFMAITLDDEVYSAPSIKSAIFNNGIIEGEFTVTQVDELVRTLNAGALTGRVNPDPVSEKAIAASLGQDNKEAGIRAAFWALIATAGFMALYYWYSGLIADTAMCLNLLLLLGAMSFVQAVFTLPGIAGTILSVTMAVDANVLIYERLREEQAKTQSMRMAIKNAYSGAFSAIFDSHVTTIVASLILAWVGTEEVRGFAITLGLGLLFSLFTSLTVTRWVYQLLLDHNIIHKQVHMLKLIGVPNVNWINKRRLFWIGSLVLSVGGFIALIAQGRDIMGIEFSSGTEAMFSFNKGRMVTYPDGKTALPDRPLVEAAIDSTAKKMAQEADDKAASASPEQAEPLRKEAAELRKLAEDIRIETVLNTHKEQLPRELGLGKDTVSREEWLQHSLDGKLFDELDANKDGQLDGKELANMPETSYDLSTTVVSAKLVQDVVTRAFGKSLNMPGKVDNVAFEDHGTVSGLGIQLTGPATLITREIAQKKDAAPDLQRLLVDNINGLMFVVDIQPSTMTEAELSNRLQTMRLQQDFAELRNNRFQVKGLQSAGGEGYNKFMVLVEPLPTQAAKIGTRDFQDKAQSLIDKGLKREETLESVQLFDPAVAGEASQMAIIALVLSWLSIIAYLWLRFGSVQWGLAAVICLIHDVAIAVGMVAISAFLAKTAIGKFLLVTPIKIDMTIVAALLTIVGYSVNDTIVVFDRIRENRGKLRGVNPTMINHAINQTLSRTILTSLATIVSLVVLYIWGGPAIHGFCYTLLIGFMVGTFSSIAVASPLLLGFKEAFIGKVVHVESLQPQTLPQSSPSGGK